MGKDLKKGDLVLVVLVAILLKDIIDFGVQVIDVRLEGRLQIVQQPLRLPLSVAHLL